MTTTHADPIERDRGRVFRTRFGPRQWSLMNRRHFEWLIRTWWDAGYKAGLKAGLKAAGKVEAR